MALLLLLSLMPAFIFLQPESANLAAVIKDGETLLTPPPTVSCSMCSSCDNPCLPLPSPPPQEIDCSPPPLPPSPPPPESPLLDCPPPPTPNLPIYYYSPPPPPTPNLPIYYYSPPPPLTPLQPSGGSVYVSPPLPDAGGGGICVTCNGGSGYQTPPPPNPILPYYPFYFYSPPSATDSAGHRRSVPISFCSSVLLLFLVFFYP